MKGQAPPANGTTSGWGPVRTVLNFGALLLCFISYLDRGVEHKLSKFANRVISGGPVNSLEGRGKTL